MLINFLHIALAFSLFTSSVGVVINQHFCRGELKHSTLFAAAKSCHDPAREEHQPACPFHQPPVADAGLEQPDCCANDSQFYKTSQEQQMEIISLSDWVISPFVVDLGATISGPFLADPASEGYKYYRPPPLIRDFPVRFQVFRL